MFPEVKPRKTVRLEEKEINCFLRDQSVLSDLLYSWKF